MSGSENFLKPHQLYLPSCEPERGRGKEEVAVVAGVPALEVGRIRGKFTVTKYAADLDEWIDKYGSDEGLERFPLENRPYEVLSAGNLLTVAGVNYLWKCAIGLGVAPAVSGTVSQNILNLLTRYSACIGVGDGGGSVPTPSSSDSDLTASSNYNYVNAVSAPAVSTNQLTIAASFSGSIGNYHWRELATGNAAASIISDPYAQWSQGLGQGITAKISTTPGVAAYSLISKLGTDLGVKSSGSTWGVSWQCTIS